MRSSSPRCKPCRCAMRVGISTGTPGPSAGFSSRARCSQLNEPTSSSIWHEPPSRKNPWLLPAMSAGASPATIGITACAPGTSVCRRRTVSVGSRPATFGMTSTTPLSAAWVNEGPKESNGRTNSDLRMSTPSTTVTPSATPITLSSVRRQSAASAARWIRRKDSHPARSGRITAPRRTSRGRRVLFRRLDAVLGSRSPPPPGHASPRRPPRRPRPPASAAG